nr:LysR family transcriptional regulator [Streptomyces atratus]
MAGCESYIQLRPVPAVGPTDGSAGCDRYRGWLEIRRLRHFMAVVTHGGFTAAARAEPIVQSPLSTSVRNLEREPGAELFDRSGRRVILTEAGRALLPSARSVLAGTQAARDAVAALSGLVTGRVRIGRLAGDAPRVARDAGRAAAGRPGGRRPPAG